MRRVLLLFFPLLPACTLNPAFDPALTSEVASTGPATPTTGGDEAHELEPSTGTTTTGTTTAETTTAALTTTSDATTSSTTADDSTSTADDSTTESADDRCWHLPPESWLAELTVLENFEDLDPHDPVIAADGLSLVYIASSDYQPFRTTRATRSDPFLNGAPITLWGPTPPFLAGYPRFSLAGEELLTSYDKDIYFSVFQPGDMNDQYTFPELLSGPVNTAKDEAITTITEDGTILIVQRDDTLPMEPFPFNHRFYQFTRQDPHPGDKFMDGQDVTPHVDPHGFALCPTLSPDGLHLLFASTDSVDFNEMNIADVVQIFSTTRATLTAEWDPPVRLDAIAPGGGVLCPTSITADGCALTYTKFEYGGFTTLPYTMYLLERTP